jgi:hypothetical protein
VTRCLDEAQAEIVTWITSARFVDGRTRGPEVAPMMLTHVHSAERMQGRHDEATDPR